MDSSNILLQQAQGAIDQSQEIAEQKKEEAQSIAEQKIAQVKEPIQLIGAELLTNSVNSIGSYLTKKTGIQAFKTMGDNIKKNGFEKGFTDTLGKAKDEVGKKGSQKLNQAIAEVENKKKDIQKAVQGKIDDTKAKAQTFKTKAEKQLEAGKENFKKKVNKDLQNKGKKQLKKISSTTNLDKKIKEAQAGPAETEDLTEGEQLQIKNQYNEDIKQGKISSKNPRQYEAPEDEDIEDDEDLYSKLQSNLSKPIPTLEESQQEVNPFTSKPLDKSKINKSFEPDYNQDDLFFDDGTVKGTTSIADDLDFKYNIEKQRSYIQNQLKLNPDPLPEKQITFKPQRITESQLKEQRIKEAQQKSIGETKQEDLSNLTKPKDIQSDIEKLDNVPNSIDKHNARKQQVIDQFDRLGNEPIKPTRIQAENLEPLGQPSSEERSFESVFQDFKPQQVPSFLQKRPPTPDDTPKPDEPPIQAEDVAEGALGSKAETTTASESLSKGFTPNKPFSDIGEAVEKKGVSTGLADAAGDAEVLGGGPEDPITDVISGVLGIGSLIASAFEKPHLNNSWTPTLQASQQFGTGSS